MEVALGMDGQRLGDGLQNAIRPSHEADGFLVDVQFFVVEGGSHALQDTAVGGFKARVGLRLGLRGTDYD